MKLKELFEKKLEILEDDTAYTDDFGVAVNNLKTLHDILRTEEEFDLREREFHQRERELELRERQINAEEKVKAEEAKNKKFDSVMKVVGIVVGGVLTVGQIVLVGKYEENGILNGHMFQFINKKNV